MEMIFEVFEGQPIPLLPRHADGTERVPDGISYYTIEQMSVKSGRSADWLRRLWVATCSPLIEDEPETPPAAAATVATVPAANAAAIGAAPAVSPRAKYRWQLKLDLLKLMKYPHLSQEHFAQFVALCEECGLNPLWEEIFCEVAHDPRTELPQIRMIIGLVGYRRLAHETQGYAGCDEAKFEYGEDARIPLKCTVTVHRLAGERRYPYTGTALWDEHYKGESAQENDVVKEKPHACLESRAEIAALRKAFPERFGRLYLPGECTPSAEDDPGEGNRRPAPKDRLIRNPAELVSDDTPKTWKYFNLDLERLGIFDKSKIDNIIGYFEARYPRLRQRSEEQFYAVVMHVVSEDPAAWGAEVLETAS